MEYNEKLQIEIDDFIEERLQENYKKIMEFEDNRKILKSYYDLFDKLTEIITNRNLISQYKKAELDVYSIQLKEAYKMGFEDSLNIFIKK